MPTQLYIVRLMLYEIYHDPQQLLSLIICMTCSQCLSHMTKAFSQCSDLYDERDEHGQKKGD